MNSAWKYFFSVALFPLKMHKMNVCYKIKNILAHNKELVGTKHWTAGKQKTLHETINTSKNERYANKLSWCIVYLKNVQTEYWWYDQEQFDVPQRSTEKQKTPYKTVYTSKNDTWLLLSSCVRQTPTPSDKQERTMCRSKSTKRKFSLEHYIWQPIKIKFATPVYNRIKSSDPAVWHISIA